MPSCDDFGDDLDNCMNGYEDCMAEGECDDDWREDYEECADDCLPHPILNPWDCGECTWELYQLGQECAELEAKCEEQMLDCETEFLDWWSCLEEHPYYQGD